MITWLYDVDAHCNAYRVPIDLDTLAVDWLRIEPWHDPPLVSRVRTRKNLPASRRYPVRIRIEQVRSVVKQMSNPTHKQIAEIINVSESWVCRIRQMDRAIEEQGDRA